MPVAVTLKFAVVRIVLTAALGYLFAFPMRPLIVSLITRVLHLPLPAIPNAEVMMGGVGLTASAGLAGWVEFLLLRGAMTRRVGAVQLEKAYLVKLWIAAIVAGLGSRFLAKYLVALIVPHIPILPHIIAGGLIAGIFGLIYFASGVIFRVPEARATLRRIPGLR